MNPVFSPCFASGCSSSVFLNRMHPNKCLQSVLSTAETLCVPCDWQGRRVHNCWQCERVGAALQEHPVLCWLLRGDRWPAQGWRSRWGDTNKDNWITFKRNVCACWRVCCWFLLLQLAIKWRSAAQTQPARPRYSGMSAPSNAFATRTCATATSPGAKTHVKSLNTPAPITKVLSHICATCSALLRNYHLEPFFVALAWCSWKNLKK